MIKSASKQGLRELRSILTVLRAVDADEPTEPTPGLTRLDSLVENTRRAGLPTTVTITGHPTRLPAAADLAAYRIVQESLTNSLRHAGPAKATVRLDYGDGQLTIDIVDTGTGSEERGPSDGFGHGVIGMRERAAALGGLLDSGRGPRGGYPVHACLPIGDSTQLVGRPTKPDSWYTAVERWENTTSWPNRLRASSRHPGPRGINRLDRRRTRHVGPCTLTQIPMAPIP